MAQKDREIKHLKSDMLEMWKLVSDQMKKSMRALVAVDVDLASEVLANEKKVNGMEVKINSDCENIFALYNPVAIDLRLVLALLRINTNLERIGDIAASVAKFVIKTKDKDYQALLEKTRTLEMFEEACDLIDGVMNSFSHENPDEARNIFRRDKILNEINKSARAILIDEIKKDPEEVEYYLGLLSIIRKLERSGDQSKNIAEEIIYYIEAKVVKHMPKGNGN
jgi:phosphate transport system protein